jgi:four helix bundle protein
LRPEFIQFLYIACGSLSELDTQVILATRLGYISAGTALEEGIQRVGMLLTDLIAKLRRS